MLNVQPGQKVLEIGFGTGRSLVPLAYSVGETGKIYGIDISDGMIRISKGKISRTGLSNRINLHLGDATKLPFKNNFIDAIFISFTLELFDLTEIQQILVECNRVLLNGGRLGVVALEKKECLAVKIYEWFHAHWPVLVDCRPIHVQRLIEMADFDPIEARDLVIWGLPVNCIIARKHE